MTAIPWDDLRLTQVEESAKRCPTNDACNSDVLALAAEVRRSQPRLAALEAVVEAADHMAGSIDELLSGDVEMMLRLISPLTYEAFLMLIQMLGVRREAYRAARASAREGE